MVMVPASKSLSLVGLGVPPQTSSIRSPAQFERRVTKQSWVTCHLSLPLGGRVSGGEQKHHCTPLGKVTVSILSAQNHLLVLSMPLGPRRKLSKELMFRPALFWNTQSNYLTNVAWDAPCCGTLQPASTLILPSSSAHPTSLPHARPTSISIAFVPPPNLPVQRS